MKNIIKSTFFFLVVLIGCSKDSINNPDGTRLYKVSYQAIGFDSASTYIIEYDINDRPVRIQEIYKNSYLNEGNIDIKYDTKGRFAGYTRQGDSFSFEYDQQDRIIRQYQKGIHTNGQTQLKNEYSYDNRGRLISVQGQLFQYDDSSNVAEVRSPAFVNNNGITTSIVIYQATYNKSPNAWNKIGMQMYFVFGEPLMLSKHNPVSFLYLSTYKDEYTYEYYVSGYPKSVTIKTSISGNGDYSGRIEYEFR